MLYTRYIQEAAEPYEEKTQEVAGTESRDQSGSTQEAAKALYRRKPCLDRSVRRHRWFSGSQVVCFFLLGFCPGVSSSYSCNFCPSGCPSSCFPNPRDAMDADVIDYNTVAWSGCRDNFTNEAMVPVPCLHDRVCIAGLPAVHTSLFPSLLKSLHVGLPIMYGASVLLTCCAAMWGSFCLGALVTRKCLSAQSKQECANTAGDSESPKEPYHCCQHEAAVLRLLRRVVCGKFLPSRRVSGGRRLKRPRLRWRRRARHVRVLRRRWWCAGRLPHTRLSQKPEPEPEESDTQLDDTAMSSEVRCQPRERRRRRRQSLGPGGRGSLVKGRVAGPHRSKG